MDGRLTRWVKEFCGAPVEHGMYKMCKTWPHQQCIATPITRQSKEGQIHRGTRNQWKFDKGLPSVVFPFSSFFLHLLFLALFHILFLGIQFHLSWRRALCCCYFHHCPCEYKFLSLLHLQQERDGEKDEERSERGRERLRDVKKRREVGENCDSGKALVSTVAMYIRSSIDASGVHWSMHTVWEKREASQCADYVCVLSSVCLLVIKKDYLVNMYEKGMNAYSNQFHTELWLNVQLLIGIIHWFIRYKNAYININRYKSI